MIHSPVCKVAVYYKTHKTNFFLSQLSPSQAFSFTGGRPNFFCKVNKVHPGTCSTTSGTCIQGQINKMAAHMLSVGSLFALRFSKM